MQSAAISQGLTDFTPELALFGCCGLDAAPCSLAPKPAKYMGLAVARRFPQVSQVFLNIACPLSPGRDDEISQQRWRLAASLAANQFGGGMSAPLVYRIREQLGLAYTAHSTMEAGDVWANFVIHAVTTPDKLDALVSSTAGLLREQATNIDPVQLERAKNQLIVSRVRAGERTYPAMEQAVEELFASATVTPIAGAIAVIEDTCAAEVQAVFERMLANPPSVALAGKGATARAARRLAALLLAPGGCGSAVVEGTSPDCLRCHSLTFPLRGRGCTRMRPI